MPQVTPALEDTDPAQIGAYRLVGRLGSGGQGVVYLGEAPDGRQVAVKVLRPRRSADGETWDRFYKELFAARRVTGFCTARILDAGVHGTRPYIVSEYIDGPSLAEAVRAHGPFPADRLQALAVGTGTALSLIHQAGVVHRDFKPGNVLLAPDGPRVIDFGVARAVDAAATVTGHVVGSVAYMAPEQARGDTVGPAADVFAWGCTMAFAATGRPPFGDDEVPAVLYRIATLEPDLHGVPEPLRGIVAACLAKDPAARPSPRQVLQQVTRPSGGVQRVTPNRRRRPFVVVAVAAAVLVAVGAIGWALLPGPGPQPRPHPPQATVPAAFAGSWSGTADQVNRPRRWTVRMSLSAGAASGRFELPSLRCSGDVQIIQATSSRLELRQVTEGTEPLCKSQARLSAWFQDNALLMKWNGVDPVIGARLSKETFGAPRSPSSLAGAWSMTMRPQASSFKPRKVKITLRGGAIGVIGTVEYPDLGCRGNLAITSGVSDSLWALEDFGDSARCATYNGTFNLSTYKGGWYAYYPFRPSSQDPIVKAYEGSMSRA